MNRDSKIYIAGDKGLVGSAITKALREKGYTNFVFRTFEELDLTNQSAVAEFFATEQPEYVFLAAARVGGIIANNTYRAQFIYENLMIQNNVIHQAYLHGVKKLLFLGSTCIYPRDCQQPMKEEYLLTGPLEQTNEPYAIAKIAGLKMCENYNRQYGTTFISVMPTNLYGPNDNFDLEKSHVLPALLRKIYLGKWLENEDWESIRADLTTNPLGETGGDAGKNDIIKTLAGYGIKREADNKVMVEIWGSGTPLRELMYSEDMARACIHIMESEQAATIVKENPSFSWINIGTGEEVSIRGLAERLQKIIGFGGKLYFNTEKPDGTPRKLTDTTRLASLGYQHETDIDRGLEIVCNTYLRMINNTDTR